MAHPHPTPPAVTAHRRLAEAEQLIEHLRAALAWYAQPTNYYATFHATEAGYELQSPILADRGARAREALGE